MRLLPLPLLLAACAGDPTDTGPIVDTQVDTDTTEDTDTTDTTDTDTTEDTDEPALICPAGLVLTELMVAPDAGGGHDWLEIHNTGAVSVLLDRLTLTQEDGALALSGAVTVPAGGYATVAGAMDPEGDFTASLVLDGLSLPSAGGSVCLMCGDVELDCVTWAQGSGGEAWSLDPGAATTTGNDDPANWCPAVTPLGAEFGTPSAENPGCPVALTCPDAPTLAITEVHRDAAGDDSALEFVEIANLGADAVPLSCLRFLDGDTPVELDACTTDVLDPGAFLLVARDPTAWAPVPVSCDASMALANEGEPLGVGAEDSTGAVTTIWSFECGADCPATTGVSAQVDPAHLGDTDLGSWCASTTAVELGTSTEYASPGLPNTACVLGEDAVALDTLGVGDLLITEYMASPAGADEDREYIEITNTTSDVVSLLGLTVPCTIDTPATIDPGGYLVLVRNDDPTLNDGLTDTLECSFTLPGTGATIELGGDWILDTVTYTEAVADTSTQRSVEGGVYTETWCASTSMYSAENLGTPGQPNEQCGE